MPSAVAVVSGGMDSVTLVHHMLEMEEIDTIFGISFNYGQRHSKELTFAAKLQEKGLLAEHHVVDITTITHLISNSVLTDHTREVPDGHYAEENMKQTVVPNRNMIMLSIAAGFAVSKGASAGVWTAVHAGDHFIYPDCRPVFIDKAASAVLFGNEGFIAWQRGPIVAPFIELGKHDICGRGAELKVDYSQTWSCYKGGDIHCGSCGTCVERKEAFRLSETPDPTEYLDEAFEIAAYRGA